MPGRRLPLHECGRLEWNLHTVVDYFRFARQLPRIGVTASLAQDQCVASKRIFCARQFKSSATYSSFSEGQAIS